MMNATIKDIARESGVSTATVSRVLNNLGGYSSAVEQRVLTIAKNLNYHKNENARSLVQQNSLTIGIIMPHVTTSFYEQIVNGIEGEAYENNYSVIITHAGIDGVRVNDSINLLVERRVDGIILLSMALKNENVHRLEQLPIPVLLLSTEVQGSKLPFLKVDDYAASFVAVEYLISQGHKRIAYIGASPTDTISGQPRIRGYLDAMKKHQLHPQEEDIQPGDFGFTSGQEAMEKLVGVQSDVTAVACASDEVAMGALSVCYKHHIRIPKDLSIIGYDNSAIASMATPPLTTISQPFYEMGKLGCQKLLDSVKNGTEIDSQIVPFQVVERETVRKQ